MMLVISGMILMFNVRQTATSTAADTTLMRHWIMMQMTLKDISNLQVSAMWMTLVIGAALCGGLLRTIFGLCNRKMTSAINVNLRCHAKGIISVILTTRSARLMTDAAISAFFRACTVRSTFAGDCSTAAHGEMHIETKNLSANSNENQSDMLNPNFPMRGQCVHT